MSEEQVTRDGRSPHGFPVRVKTIGPNGQDQVERIVFASARRHPKLKEHLEGIRQADVEYAYLTRKLALASRRLFAAGGGDMFATDEALATTPVQSAAELDQELEAARAAMEEVSKAEDAGEQKTLDLRVDFYRAALRCAGYTDELIEQYLPALPLERFHELRRLCLTGCGLADFTGPAST